MDSPLIALADVLALVTANERVCPQPNEWNKLYDLLPNKRRVGNDWEPALPLILAAWHGTPATLKMQRLREHIEWAENHGAIGRVHAFLLPLPEEKWHHLDE